MALGEAFKISSTRLYASNSLSMVGGTRLDYTILYYAIVYAIVYATLSINYICNE
jgi:hypothetical protein